MNRARLYRYNDDEVFAGNIYCWDISGRLRDGVKKAKTLFMLHTRMWQYKVSDYDGFLNACIDPTFCESAWIDCNFNIRAGIIGEDLKEIVSFNTGVSTQIKLISISQLDSIRLTNKFVYLFAEIERKGDNALKIKDGKEKIDVHFKELLLTGENSDVTIEVNHKKFKCHRYILEARSFVFSTMFKKDMKEENSFVVKIEDTDPAVFQEFLIFLYSGNKDCLSWKNIADIYKLADKYSVDKIKYICRDGIAKNINKENFFEFFKLACLHDDSELRESLIQFFLKESNEFVRRENWMTYLTENPVECNILMIALADELANVTKYKKRNTLANL